jgi:hypothetical protein
MNDTLHRDCRNAKPRPAKPSSIIAQVEGSVCAVLAVLFVLLIWAFGG